MAKIAKDKPPDRGASNILTIGYKVRTDKHYVTLVEGANIQNAFEAWLKDGKVKSVKFIAYVLVNGEPGPTYSTVVDLSDVSTVFTAPYPSA